MRSCGLMQKLIKFNLAHEDTMMRLHEFLSKGINFDRTINATKKEKIDKSSYSPNVSGFVIHVIV